MMQIMREMSCGFHRALATGRIIIITSFSWQFFNALFRIVSLL